EIAFLEDRPHPAEVLHLAQELGREVDGTALREKALDDPRHTRARDGGLDRVAQPRGLLGRSHGERRAAEPPHLEAVLVDPERDPDAVAPMAAQDSLEEERARAR